MNWSKKCTKQQTNSEDDEQPYQYVVSESSSSIKVVENKIFFYDDVSNNSILELNKTLLEMDSKLQHTMISLGAGSVDPIIHLHLKTDGGEVDAAIANIDFMSQLKSKVHTYVEGCVASAGTLMSVAGDYRYMGRKSYLLIHQLSGDMYGKYSEMQDHIYNSEKMMKFMKAQYKEYTNIPMKVLDKLFNTDILLDAEECLAYGIIDEIL